MRKLFTTLLFCAAAQAATFNVTLTVNANATISTSITATGTATLTGDIKDNGTFSATVPTSALSSSTVSVPYNMTLGQGTMGGMLSIPLAILTGSATSGSGTATVTNATGSYSGYTGTFNLTGSGSLNLGTGAITLSFTGPGTLTSGGPVTAPPPTVTAVLDAGSYTPNIAQGSIFVVKGSNLSDSGLNYTTYPLPTSFGSTGKTSINFTPAAGGSSTQAFLIYTYNLSGVNQLAATLPSTLATGSYNVTVTYGSNTSSSFPVAVVASKPALLTQDSTGSGLAVAQNIISATEYDLNRLTTGSLNGTVYSPAKPGQTLVAYATGLGPVPGGTGDNTASPGYDFTKNGVTVNVLVGGTSIPALYAGRAPGFSGLDQIDFTLPSNIPTGCTVTLQVQVGNVTSAATTLSIAPSSSADACVLANFTTDQLKALDQGGTYTTGNFFIEQISETIPSTGLVKLDEAGGSFTQVTGLELGAVNSNGSSTSNTIGACIVTTTTVGSSTFAGGGGADLDAGQVTLNGPSGTLLSNTPLTESSANSYSLTIGEEGINLPGSLNGKILAGTYSLAGAGGKDVGTFNTSIALGTPLTITGGLPSSVTEASGLTINWTGGNSSDIVQISGASSKTSGTGSNLVSTTTSFVCKTTAGQGTFTVPTSVLTQLPPTTSGSLDVLSTPTPSQFTATLKSGATNVATGNATVNATFSALVGTGATVAYQ